MITVYTGGVFDILHKGHLRILKRAKAMGDFLVVGIQEDSSVEAQKGRKPVLSTQERVEQMQELPFVDKVITYTSTTTPDAVKSVMPDIFVHGDDWEAQADRSEIVKFMKKNNIKLVLMPRTRDISDSEIRNRIYERF